MLRYFRFSFFVTLAAIIIAGLELGTGTAITVTVLIAIEIAFSFDNAIINAKILARLSRFWQQLFLTVGMVVAIVGMRFVFPILIVMVTAHLPWGQVIDDALHHPKVYGEHLEAAHAAISAFGGAFLLTLTFYFLFDDVRKELWLKRTERGLQKIGGTIWLPPLLVAIIVSLVAHFAGSDASTVFQAGMLGVISYTAIKLFIDGLVCLAPKEQKVYGGFSAFLAFMYLQILDASFSFDGVLGAFAITDKVLLIVLGLGVGAIWVRSLTVYMVRHGTLDAYKYLEHGAHYAILVLAVALLGSIFINVPDAVTGITGIGVIAASFISSREAIRAKKL
ncbi:hypothetical protein COY17_01515 [Candidatus Saccharibacteria bacterium CG_4_10_14_0_2_um_filter_52_9]|nr:MAG: hypothetical protein COY17_01515 [Candidatus Saccharibacteria bacterium CG_4_10_14_0_2_um_filter_52_9]